jgi:diguanylate cyclase (GGDEF)-like protein
MNTRARLNLALALTFLVLFCTTSAVLYRLLMDEAMKEVRRESTLRMEMALAVRKYTLDHVRPVLAAHGQPFDLPAIPAFAANQSMALLANQHPDYRYREVAMNPTNPANKAKGWEVEAIETFRQDPKTTELTRFTDTPAGRVMHVLRPVRPTPDCMQCHGSVAPAALFARYGTQGLDWRVGDTVGAQIVSVPTAHAVAQAREAWWWHVSATVLVFGVLFIALNRMLDRVVISPIEHRSTEWRERATRDAVTGVHNRHSFEEQAAEAMAACSERGVPLAVIALDIDHFKRVNDQFGHGVGDAVLREFAERVLASSQRCDRLYRLGGEEFALLLPGAELPAASALAETLRHALVRRPFRQVGALSASFGVAALRPGDSLHTLMERADRALYAAKEAGRNRVVTAEA